VVPIVDRAYGIFRRAATVPTAALPGMVHEPGEARRAEAERLGALPAQGMGERVQLADVAQHARDELDVA
jgi:hypothetical protein